MATDLVLFNEFFAIPDKFFRLIGVVGYSGAEARPVSKLHARLLTIFFWSSFINLFICFVGECIFFVLGFGDFDNFLKLTALAPCMAFVGMSLEEMLMIWWYRKQLGEVIMFLEEMYPKQCVQEQLQYNIPQTKSKLRWLMIYFATSYMTLISTFNFIPFFVTVYEYFQEGVWKRELPYFIWYPFDPYTDAVFPVLYFLQSWAGFTTVIAILAFNIFLGALITLFCLQFDILNTKLKLLKPSKENYKNDLKELIKLIEIHTALFENCRLMGHIFSVSIFVNYIISSLVICLVGFQVVAGEETPVIFKFMLFLICSLIQTMTMSYFGNQIIERVSDSRGRFLKSAKIPIIFSPQTL